MLGRYLNLLRIDLNLLLRLPTEGDIARRLRGDLLQDAQSRRSLSDFFSARVKRLSSLQPDRLGAQLGSGWSPELCPRLLPQCYRLLQ